MILQNRVYSPQELRAMSRLTPADRQPPAAERLTATDDDTDRRGLAVMVQRLAVLCGLRRARTRTA
jgi:hypothetical protein